MSISLTPKARASNRLVNILSCILWQKRGNILCPRTPRLDGKTSLVTGGLAGVGEFVSRGLIERGAKVFTISRGISQGSSNIADVKSISADLADPESIIKAVDQLGDTPIDILVCNAGLISQKEIHTQLGLEQTFAINVLGHHILYKLLITRGLFSPNARIIMTTGEIYTMAKECSSNIPFDSPSYTYTRSKLGNLWQVAELSKRYPKLYPIAVHPGVVASGFIGSKKTGFLAWLRQKLLISEKEGAQSSLVAVTQPIPRGAYWHNTLGIVNLPENDIAYDAERSAQLWDELEELAAPFIL